jgi:hypothetical protein
MKEILQIYHSNHANGFLSHNNSGNNNDTIQQYEKELESIYNNINEDYFLKLEGSYALWQEVQ